MRIAGVEMSQVNAILVEKDLNAVDQWNVSENAIRTWLKGFLCQLQISSWTSMDIAGGGLFVSLKATYRRTCGVRMSMSLRYQEKKNQE